MSTTFFIGDLHFGHKKVTQFRPWPTVEHHDRELIARWNGRVRVSDNVYVVGDVAFGRPALELLAQLNGTKRLVAGNHDNYSTATYMQHFTKVLGCAEVNGWLVTHIPVHESQFRRWPMNIHGHTHASSINDPRYFCVSAEQIDYTPISIEQIAVASPNGGLQARPSEARTSHCKPLLGEEGGK